MVFQASLANLSTCSGSVTIVPSPSLSAPSGKATSPFIRLEICSCTPLAYIGPDRRQDYATLACSERLGDPILEPECRPFSGAINRSTAQFWVTAMGVELELDWIGGGALAS